MNRSKLAEHRQYPTVKGAPNGFVAFVCGALGNASGACEIYRMNTLNSIHFTAADVAKAFLPDMEWDDEQVGHTRITCKQYRHCPASVSYYNGMLRVICTNARCRRRSGFCVEPNIFEKIAEAWNENPTGVSLPL